MATETKLSDVACLRKQYPCGGLECEVVMVGQASASDASNISGLCRWREGLWTEERKT
jgi:hypothetical protein